MLAVNITPTYLGRTNPSREPSVPFLGECLFPQSDRKESDLRSSAYKAAALPLSYCPLIHHGMSFVFALFSYVFLAFYDDRRYGC